jgi:KDO2-lipid IV(A) lauroyltransferase
MGILIKVLKPTPWAGVPTVIAISMTRLFRLLALLPLTWMQAMGAGLGWLVWALSPAYRRQFHRQVQAAGLSWPQVKGAIAATGMMLAELPWVWARAQGQSVLPRVQWTGLSYFESAMQAGRGVILLSPHLGCWEMGGQALAEKLGPQHGDLLALYRPPRKVWLQEVVGLSRQRTYFQTASASLRGVRALVKHLRAGGFTAILPDQVPPEGQGLWAPFFGRPVYTMNLLPKLAQQTGAVVLLAWCERHAAGHFTFHVLPPCLQALNQPQTTPEQAALLMNQAIERMVLSRPDQYLWGYARDKKPRAGD